MSKRIMAICPLCGTAHGIIYGKRKLKGKPYYRVGEPILKSDYFADLLSKYDENKPFGVEVEASGRGSFKNWRYISPQEAPQLFESVQKVFYKAIKSWLQKGWLDKKELQKILKKVK